MNIKVLLPSSLNHKTLLDVFLPSYINHKTHKEVLLPSSLAQKLTPESILNKFFELSISSDSHTVFLPNYTRCFGEEMTCVGPDVPTCV